MPIIIQIICSLMLISRFRILFVLLIPLFLIHKQRLAIVIIILFSIRLLIPIQDANISKPFVVIDQNLFRQGLNYYQGFSNHNFEIGTIVSIKGEFILEVNNEFSDYQQLNHRYSKLAINEITKIGESRLIKLISSFTNDRPIFNRLVFHSKIESTSNLVSLLVSTGLLLSSIIHQLKKGLSLFLSRNNQTFIVIFLLLVFLLISGLSFIIVRLIIKEIMSFTSLKKNKRVLIEMLICLFIYPNAYHQLVFIIPFSMRLSQFVFINKNYLKLKQSLLMVIIQLSINFRVNLFQTFLFRYFRFFSLWLLLSDLFFKDNQLIENILYKLEQSELTITGQLFWPLTVLCLSVFIFKTSRFYQSLVVTITIVFFIVFTHFNATTRIVFIDVGQGDSSLLIAPYKNSVIMIDTGRKNAYTSVKKTLDKFGINHIDYLIITHPDADHNENMAQLQKDYSIAEIITQKNQIVTTSFFNFDQLLEEVEYEDENDNSLIFNINFLNQSFLFLGDISSEVERNLIKTYPSLKVDVLKLAHHGSRTSSDEYFISKINPSYAIISSDPNIYKHPHLEVLQTLAKYKIKNLKTSEDSTIVFNYSRFLNWISTSKRNIVIK